MQIRRRILGRQRRWIRMPNRWIRMPTTASAPVSHLKVATAATAYFSLTLGLRIRLVKCHFGCLQPLGLVCLRR